MSAKELVIRIALSVKQTLAERAVRKFKKVLYGGAKGGGKSHWLRMVMIARRIMYPGSVGYIFRRNLGELEANHITPMFDQFPQLYQYWNDGKKTLHLPNGSRLRFAYVEHRGQLRKFQGREMQDLGVEEAGDWPYDHVEYLEKQRRSAKIGIPTRTLFTGNPGGIGHAWLKRLFIDRDFRENENPEDYHFIQALVEDNPALMKADPDYVRELESIRDPVLREAWRNGNWDIVAGQFFEKLSRKIHLIPRFKIPDWWIRVGAYDYGFGHPASFGWYAIDEEGNAVKYRELVKAQTLIKDFAKLINQHPDTRLLQSIWAGRDCFTKRSNPLGEDHTAIKGPSVADKFAEYKLFLKPANVARVDGARQMREYLEPFENALGETTAGLRFTEDCPITFATIARMQRDPDNIEDVEKVDSEYGSTDSGDDAYDETRHFIMSRPPRSKEPTQRSRDKYRKDKTRRSRSNTWTG